MIKIQNLGFAYGSVPVLENISLQMEAGKIYGLLGENGVGKTTLLTLLCGLKKPRTGSIVVDDKCPIERTPSFLSDVYYLPESPLPIGAIAQNWAKELGVFYPKYDQALFTQIMSEFETDPTQRMDTMSSGQLKKTYIAFALATRAHYLLMDEPTNALDIPSKSQFRRAILTHTSDDSTIVIATHQVRDLENTIDPIIILDSREVLLNASICEIASKLYFDYDSAPVEKALYCEQLPGGYLQVYPNVSGRESKVSIEALFNAVHLHKSLIRNMFNQ